jgi:hypothetical protein
MLLLVATLKGNVYIVFQNLSQKGPKNGLKVRLFDRVGLFHKLYFLVVKLSHWIYV